MRIHAHKHNSRLSVSRLHPRHPSKDQVYLAPVCSLAKITAMEVEEGKKVGEWDLNDKEAWSC